MFRKVALVTTFGLILILGLSFLFLYSFKDIGHKVCFREHCFQVELASDQEELKKGLSKRESLDGDRGMLFDPGVSGRYSFWMKGTLIPLDIIWIDESGKVVHIKEGAKPCALENCESYVSDQDARYVLEINAGKVDEMGLKVGDNTTK